MELSAILALLALVDPYIENAVKKSDVSPEEQAALKARVESIRAKAHGEFKGPEWQQSTANEEHETPAPAAEAQTNS